MTTVDMFRTGSTSAMSCRRRPLASMQATSCADKARVPQSVQAVERGWMAEDEERGAFALMVNGDGLEGRQVTACQDLLTLSLSIWRPLSIRQLAYMRSTIRKTRLRA